MHKEQLSHTHTRAYTHYTPAAALSHTLCHIHTYTHTHSILVGATEFVYSSEILPEWESG